ncbi:MAG: ParB/RepB/Spo0J family partition protein [Anaerolineales bacterium]|nr:ParB/RepB/Spo0J family partition protein [Anaerolineales bacterium]
MNIPINKIIPNPDQPRKTFDQTSLEDLAQSIRENGVIQAVTVEETGDGKYMLVDGERRLRASKLAGLTEIPAAITPYSNGAGKRLLQAMVANLQRADLNPIEEALGYKRLQKEFGFSVDQIALKTGKCRKTIDDRLLLLKLDAEIQEMIAVGSLHRDPRLAKGLLAITDRQARVQTTREIVRRRVKLDTSLRICDRVAKAMTDKPCQYNQGAPAITLARVRVQERKKRTDWDILRQLGKVPPWKVVEDAASATCEGCGLRPVASEESCRNCPAVELLRRMLEAGKP